jgi:hypothetical protein
MFCIAPCCGVIGPGTVSAPGGAGGGSAVCGIGALSPIMPGGGMPGGCGIGTLLGVGIPGCGAPPCPPPLMSIAAKACGSICCCPFGTGIPPCGLYIIDASHSLLLSFRNAAAYLSHLSRSLRMTSTPRAHLT